MHVQVASNNNVRAYHTDLPGIWGGKFAQLRNSASRHFVPDFQGHTRLLLDAAGAVTDTLVPSAWGVELARTGATMCTFWAFGQFGYFRDTANRLYVQRRHLRVDQGRWLARDPIGFGGGDWNLYGYVGNRAVADADPRGMQKGFPGIPVILPKIPPFVQVTIPPTCLQVRDCIQSMGGLGPSVTGYRCDCTSRHPESMELLICVMQQETTFGSGKVVDGALASLTADDWWALTNGGCPWTHAYRDFKDFLARANVCEKLMASYQAIQCQGLRRYGPGPGKSGDYRGSTLYNSVRQCERCLKGIGLGGAVAGDPAPPFRIGAEEGCRICRSCVHWR